MYLKRKRSESLKHMIDLKKIAKCPISWAVSKFNILLHYEKKSMIFGRILTELSDFLFLRVSQKWPQTVVLDTGIYQDSKIFYAPSQFRQYYAPGDLCGKSANQPIGRERKNK
jgi:hypothetical protein